MTRPLNVSQVQDLIRANGAGIVCQDGLTVHEALCLVWYGEPVTWAWDEDAQRVVSTRAQGDRGRYSNERY